MVNSTQQVNWRGDKFICIPVVRTPSLSNWTIAPSHNKSKHTYIETAAASGQMTFEIIRRLYDLYSFRDYLEVARFLFGNPDVSPFLFEAYVQIAAKMTGVSRSVLEVVKDPDDGSEMLFLVLPTKLSVVEARKMLADLDEAWWLDACTIIGSKFGIDLEFI